MVGLINTTLLRAMSAVSGLRARFTEQHGQDLIEYALLGGLIALALIAAAALTVYTSAVKGMAEGIKNCIDFNSATKCGMG